jgi:hypothetical protein
MWKTKNQSTVKKEQLGTIHMIEEVISCFTDSCFLLKIFEILYLCHVISCM